MVKHLTDIESTYRVRCAAGKLSLFDHRECERYAKREESQRQATLQNNTMLFC